MEDGESLPDVRAVFESQAPAHETLGRVRLKVKEPPEKSEHRHSALVIQGTKQFFAGDTFEAEGRDAEAILDTGSVEIVKHLDPKE